MSHPLILYYYPFGKVIPAVDIDSSAQARRTDDRSDFVLLQIAPQSGATVLQSPRKTSEILAMAMVFGVFNW